MRRWLPLLLLALALLLFWRLWPSPGGFLYRPNSSYSDLTVTHWPNALFIRRSLAVWKQLPLWRPLILSGEPFAANPLSGLWYPPNVLLLILPLTVAFNLLFVLHTAWAGWGAHRLARSAGASPAGALLASVLVMLAPKAVAHLASGHAGLYCAWAWLPWVVWAVRRLAERGRLGDVAAAAATGAMLVLADVRLAFYGGLVAAGYWLWHAVGERDGRRMRLLAGGASALLAGALAGVQALPLAAAAGRLSRGGLSLRESGIAPLPPRYLLGVLVADHGGFQEWMTYVGAAGLVLAFVGLIRWRRRERWGWAAVALAAAVYSLGTHTPVYGLLHRALPPLAWLRGPARAWFLVVLAVAVLAALGLTGLQGRVRRSRWTDRLAVGLAGAALAGCLGGLFMRLSANVVAAATLWPLVGCAVALRAGGRLRGSSFAALALALAVIDLGVVDSTLYRVRREEKVLAEGREAAAWLAAQPGAFRVYSPSYSIPQHTGALYGLEMADGVDPFQLADYAAFMRAATGVDVPGYSVTVPSFPEDDEGEDMFLAHRDVMPDLRLLGVLNVRYLAAAYPMVQEGLTPLGQRGGVYLYRNERVLPRAFVVQRVERADGVDGALGWLAENDPGLAAVVDGGVALGGAEGAREADVIERTPNRIVLEAEGPGLLVLGEVYDPDWRAQVDGEPASVVRADGVLRGVYLEEGRHRVTFTYWPAGLWAGVGLTAAGLACVAVLWIAGRRSYLARFDFPRG